MDEKTFIIYELPALQENNFFWRAYKIRKNDKITYEKLLSSFLDDYSKSKKIEVNRENVTFFVISDVFANSFTAITDFGLEVNLSTDSEFYVSFSKEEDHPIYAKPEISDQLMNIGMQFKKEKKYLSALHFFQHVETYGLIEISKICYILHQWEYIKNIIGVALIYSPNDFEIVKFAADYYQQVGNTTKSTEIYKKYKSKAPIFNIIYQRIFLQHEKQRCVDKIVEDALLDANSQNNDCDLLLECAKLLIKNNQLQEACKLCSLNHDFLYNCIEYFCTVPNLPKIYRSFVMDMPLPPYSAALISRKLFKYRENKNALKIAESLFKNNRYNFLCVLIYLDLLLRSYEYDKLVDVITLFFTILPKKMGKYDVEKFAALLQSSSTFRSQTFNPILNPDFEYCEIEFEPDDELDSRLNCKFQGNSRIRHPDLNKIVDELCSQDNMLCFEIIIMIISVFFFVIGDVASYKNIISKFGNLITFDSNTIPHFFYDIQQMYQSANIVKNSAFPLMSNSLNMLVVGDVHSVSCCNTKVIIQNKTYYITSLPIENISIYDLREESKNYRKELFFRFIRKSDQFRKLMIVIGTKDCEKIIPKLFKKMIFSLNPSLAAIKYIVDLYSGILDDISSSFPRKKILVHCALCRFSWAVPIVERFNIELYKKIKGKYSFISPFAARSKDNYFTISGITDGVLDSRYSINLNTSLNKLNVNQS